MNLSRENIVRFHRQQHRAGVQFGDVTYPPGGLLGPRVQQDVQLVVLLRGWAEIALDGRPLRVEAGQGIVLLPGRTERFRFAPDRETRHTWCALRPDRLAPDLGAALEGAARPFAWSVRLNTLMEHGLNFPPGARPEAGQVLEHLAVLLLCSVAFEALPGASEPPLSPALERACAYIEAHLHEEITLEQLAAAVGLTPQHLTRLFRAGLDTSPMRYVWHLRVARGLELLRSTGLSVTAIAERLGFGSPFHFSRRVREQVGVSPRALRQAAWRGEERAE